MDELSLSRRPPDQHTSAPERINIKSEDTSQTLPSIFRVASQGKHTTQAEDKKRKRSSPDVSHQGPQKNRTGSTRPGKPVVSSREETKLNHPRPISPNVKIGVLLEERAGTEQCSYNPEAVSSFVSDWVYSLGNSLKPSSAPIWPEGTDHVLARTKLPRPLSTPARMPPESLPAPVGSQVQFLASGGQQSGTSLTTPSSGEKARVASRSYRRVVMLQHGIYLEDTDSTPPSHIALLADAMWSSRSSPGPTREAVASDRRLRQLAREGLLETAVQTYFDATIFAKSAEDSSGLVSTGQSMLKSSLPPQKGAFSLACPKPDLLYGCNDGAFTISQRLTLSTMGDSILANTSGLLFPFLVVAYRADSGGMYGAENECMNASAACINIAETLNRRAEALGLATPDSSTVFSVVLNAEAARLYVSYLSGSTYRTHQFAWIGVQDPDSHIKLRRAARNIIDWGLGRRLAGIKSLLDKMEGLV